MSNEITFIGNCELCARRDVACLTHHLIPRRLLNILPQNRRKRWEHNKIIVCQSCNSYLHPENHLYEKIKYLESRGGINNG